MRIISEMNFLPTISHSLIHPLYAEWHILRPPTHNHVTDNEVFLSRELDPPLCLPSTRLTLSVKQAVEPVYFRDSPICKNVICNLKGWLK